MTLTTAVAVNMVLMAGLVAGLLLLLGHFGIWRGLRHDRLLLLRRHPPGQDRRATKRRWQSSSPLR